MSSAADIPKSTSSWFLWGYIVEMPCSIDHHTGYTVIIGRPIHWMLCLWSVHVLEMVMHSCDRHNVRHRISIFRIALTECYCAHSLLAAIEIPMTCEVKWEYGRKEDEEGRSRIGK
jgi:hypothetical protein